MTPIWIAVQGKNGARLMILIILKTRARKEEKIKIAGCRPSAETVVFESAGGRASARIRSCFKIVFWPNVFVDAWFSRVAG